MIEENQINRITERIIGAAIEVHRAWTWVARIDLSRVPRPRIEAASSRWKERRNCPWFTRG